MFKKLLAMLLSVIMILGMGTTAFAADASVVSEKEGKETIAVDELIDQLSSIDFDSDVTFTALPQSKLSDQGLLEFDSVEDAEAYLKELMEDSSKLIMPSESSMQNSIIQQIDANARAKKSAGWYSTVVTWWGGGNTSLLSLTNAEVEFYYNGSNKISKITVNDSYMTGIAGATWTHRSGTAKALGGMDAKYSVTGTWFVGLSIMGFPLGASFNETLKSRTKTMDMN